MNLIVRINILWYRHLVNELSFSKRSRKDVIPIPMSRSMYLGNGLVYTCRREKIKTIDDADAVVCMQPLCFCIWEGDGVDVLELPAYLLNKWSSKNMNEPKIHIYFNKRVTQWWQFTNVLKNFQKWREVLKFFIEV